MLERIGRALLLFSSIYFLNPVAATACELPAGTSVWLQLRSSVSSYYSKPGDAVSAVLDEDLLCLGEVAIPAGTPVEGRVNSLRKVGWGIRHETASLRLEFDTIRPNEDTSLELDGRLLEVANAREAVKNGVILGIRSTDTPQGRINSRLKHLPAWNPYSDTFLLGYKITFPIFPEPEIWYGPGTELRLKLVAPLTLPTPQTRSTHPNDRSLTRDLSAIVNQMPQHVFTEDEKEADVVNLAFAGTEKQLQSAFQSAGWVGSDKFSRKSFLHEFGAFLNHSGYATAPMRPMLLGGVPPTMQWQKSLNTYAKRDHLRVWQSALSGGDQPLWIGSATRDTGATLSIKYKRFLHRIDPEIDQERAKIVRDLKVAGCVQSVQLVDRAGFPNYLVNATGDPVMTDGRLAVIEFKDCESPSEPHVAARKFKPGNVVFRFVRRQILTFRSDIWRANIIYAGYDAIRMLSHAVHSEKAAVARNKPQPAEDPNPESD